MLKNNYYISSFFWSAVAKILNAVFGFISVPLLLGFYGKAEYGILSIATACNGYMQLLDLGMNTGAVKFFSQWKAEGKTGLIFRVARTNISFYLIISVFNILGLLALALLGESLFSVTHQEFLQIRSCLYIIALFSVFGWVTTAFNQLLIADKQMDFTMRVQCVQVVLKAILIFIVLTERLSLMRYFFYLTLIGAASLIPYAVKCHRDYLIDSVRPAVFWNDFKVVLTFSLSIFALSFFQMTATQSRPLILSVFAYDGADAVANFRILEVVPQLIIMIGGTFSGIFLPKTSEMVARNDQKSIQIFAYKWTKRTTVIVNILCFPFILSASEVLSAYVGPEYANLSHWLILWCYTVLLQMHTTPGNALVLAYGRTKLLVVATAVDCILSILLNMFLCKYLGVGSVIVAYFLYVLIIIGLYYFVFYKKLLNLSRLRLLQCFFVPTFIAIIVYFAVKFIPINVELFGDINRRLAYVLVCSCKTVIWFVPYVCLLLILNVVSLEKLKK